MRIIQLNGDELLRLRALESSFYPPPPSSFLIFWMRAKAQVERLSLASRTKKAVNGRLGCVDDDLDWPLQSPNPRSRENPKSRSVDLIRFRTKIQEMQFLRHRRHQDTLQSVPNIFFICAVGPAQILDNFLTCFKWMGSWLTFWLQFLPALLALSLIFSLIFFLIFSLIFSLIFFFFSCFKLVSNLQTL